MISRIPPQDTEAESIVIGTMLIAPKSIPAVLAKLSPEDFYKQSHTLIFSAIQSLHTANAGVDLLTVSSSIRDQGNLEVCGGPVYLASLTGIVPQTAHIGSYCQIVGEKAKARRLIEMAADISGRCFDGEKTDELFSDLGKFITDQAGSEAKEAQTFAELVPGVVENIKRRSGGDPDAMGLSTGFADLDKITGGLQKSDLIILAGRPSMGKTTLAMNIACNVARKSKKVLVFSLEMDREKLVEKQLAALSGVSWGKIQNGVYDDPAWAGINGAANELSRLPVTIDDSPSLHIQRISAKAKAHAMAKGVDLIILDYLGLAKGSSDKREREISEISAGLKAIAKHLKIPVLCLSQLSRVCESRADKKPILSDLRDSGSIEQDADIVAFIYRDEIYNPDPSSPLKGIAEVIIRKNRCGMTGSVSLYFDGSRSMFGNI